MKMIYVKRLHMGARIPTRANPTDAGLDFYTDMYACIGPGERLMMTTGVAIALQHGKALIMKDRSGLALKYGVHVLAGVMDADYRDEVRVILYNSGKEAVEIFVGNRICQGIEINVDLRDPVEVDELPSGNRGGGLGSTGI
jgi:dUTP pyrophosphatase